MPRREALDARISYTTLRLHFQHNLALILLNRPEKRNAISPEMIRDLTGALHEAESARVHVVILTGAGHTFCAGMDLAALKEFSTEPLDKVQQDARRIAQMFRRIYFFPKPIIAAVNGAAIAGGCGIATLADFTLAVPDAKFGYTEVQIGFIPAIVSVFVVRQIGEKRARDLLLSGRIFGAEEARDLGLVNEIVPREKLLDRAHELGAALASMSPIALVHAKRLLGKLAEAEIDRELELSIQESVLVRATADFHEGLTAFLEKRKPLWRGK